MSEPLWTTIQFTLTHPKKRGDTSYVDCRIMQKADSELRDPNSGLVELRQPDRHSLEGVLFEMFNGGKPLDIGVTDSGKARIYSGGGKTIAIAWMDDKPPPSKFLIQAAEKMASFPEKPTVIRWPDGEPK